MSMKWCLTIGLLLCLTGLLAPPSWAQAQSPQAVPLAGKRQYLAERVGVDPSRQRRVSLHDVILMALQKNRDIEIERINGQMTGYELTSAHGAFDPVLNSTLSFQSDTEPVGSVLAGGASGSVSTDTYTYNLSLRQLLPGGGSYELSFDNSRLSSSNVFITFKPQYTSTLKFILRQPLLRNLGMDANRRAIRIAQKQLDLSDADFRRRVIEIINQVQKAYWDLVFTLRNAEVQQEAVGLAEQQLEMNRRMVAAGTLAPVEIIAAEAELKRREEDLLMAVEGVTSAENALKGLILARRTDSLWDEVIVPTETMEIQSVPMDLTEAIHVALSSRPEIQQLKYQHEMNDIDLHYYGNQTKPQIDVVASYGINGLAGKVRAGDNPFSSASSILLDRVNLISEVVGIPPVILPPPAQLPGFLIGGQGQALSNLFGSDFRTVEFGISISLPLRNRTAEGNLGHARAQKRRLNVQREKLEQAIEVDVRNALQAVETARKRVEAARASRQAAETNLASEGRRYRAGETTNFLVLTRQNELSTARSHEVRALMDYNKAVAELQRATATTLNAHNVSIESPPQSP